MKLHYMGKFNLDPDSLPQAEHKPGAVEFKEADSMKKLSVIANTVACIILAFSARRRSSELFPLQNQNPRQSPGLRRSSAL